MSEEWVLSSICVRHNAGRKILDVSVAQPKTCKKGARENGDITTP